jgi:hypothetical protein
MGSVLLSTASAGAARAAEQDELLTYDIPGKLLYSHHIDDFTVRVRQPGGSWQDLYEYRVTLDQDTHTDATVVQFDFRGEVEVAIRKNNGDFRRVEVRPSTGAPEPTIVDGIVYLTLNRPRNLSVEFDGDRLRNLHVLAGEPVVRPEAGEGVVFFEPGLHVPADASGFFPVKSGQTIYVAGGAVLQGTFKTEDVEDVRVIGRGIIDHPKHQLVVQSSKNVRVEGLTFLEPLHGTIACSSSSGVTFADIRTFSDGQWSDGINVFACEDVRIERAFVRTSDDSVAVYATRKMGKGSTRRIEVRESVFWPDVAHAMFVGLHGDGDLIADVVFDDIDVLGLDEDDPEYQGAMAISAGDGNTIRNVTFSNIRIDHIEEGKLFNVRVVYNAKYSHSPGAAVEDIMFKDISYTGKGWPTASIIAGYDASRRVKGIVFENVAIDGVKLRAPARDVLEVGAFVDSVEFR